MRVEKIEPVGGEHARWQCQNWATSASLWNFGKRIMVSVASTTSTAWGAQHIVKAQDPTPDDFLESCPAHLQEFYPEQLEVLAALHDMQRSGGGVFFWEAPPGAGKSLIPAVLASKSLSTGGITVTVLTPRRGLQQQYNDDFGASTIWGRGNYPCLNEDVRAVLGEGVTAEDCPFASVSPDGHQALEACKHWCNAISINIGPGTIPADWPGLMCPYYAAKKQAATAPLLVVNYAYALTIAGVGNATSSEDFQTSISGNWFYRRLRRGVPCLLVLDEAHVLPSLAPTYFGVDISERQRQKYHLPAFPAWNGAMIFRDQRDGFTRGNNTTGEVLSWCDAASRVLTRRLAEFDLLGGRRHSNGQCNIQERVARKPYFALLFKIKQITTLASGYTATVGTMDDRWVVYTDATGLHIRPLWAPTLLWKTMFESLIYNGGTVLCMSATLGDPSWLAQQLGMAYDDMPAGTPAFKHTIKYARHYVGTHVVKKQDRPIVLVSNAPFLSRRSSEQTHAKQRKMIADAIKTWQLDAKDITVLVHCASWKQTGDVAAALRNLEVKNVCEQKRGLDNVSVLAWADNLPPGSVIVSPSLREGWDPPAGHTPGLIIWAKTPYPDLSDPVLKKRGDVDRGVTDQEVMYSLAQGSGRGTRRAGDRCLTLIFDRTSRTILEGHMPPAWFREALAEKHSVALGNVIYNFLNPDGVREEA